MTTPKSSFQNIHHFLLAFQKLIEKHFKIVPTYLMVIFSFYDFHIKVMFCFHLKTV